MDKLYNPKSMLEDFFITMEGYKIRQTIIYGDSRAAKMSVYSNLDIYEDLMVLSNETFQRDEGIAELCLFFCWDNEGHMPTEACLLKMWAREENG